MKYRIVRDNYDGREVQLWNGGEWIQCGSGGHRYPDDNEDQNIDVNTFTSHLAAVIFMTIHDMNYHRSIICEDLSSMVADYKIKRGWVL